MNLPSAIEEIDLSILEAGPVMDSLVARYASVKEGESPSTNPRAAFDVLYRAQLPASHKQDGGQISYRMADMKKFKVVEKDESLPHLLMMEFLMRVQSGILDKDTLAARKELHDLQP